ncbi:MAG: alginate export family protein [Planctomycetota bacterium]|jgi:hypothetical protein
MVTEVELLDPSKAGESDKVDITAPLQALTESGEIRLLEQDVEIGSSTTYENADRETVPPFPLEIGSWLRVKTRETGAGGLRTRTIRSILSRGKFTIEGELRGYEPETGRIGIGPLTVPLAQDPSLDLLAIQGSSERGDPLALFVEDDHKGVPFTLNPYKNIYLGGQGSFKSEYDDEFDLNESNDRDRAKLRSEGKLDLLLIMDDRASFVLIEGKFKRTDRLREGDRNTTENQWSLSRAYAYLRFSDLFRLQFGRQDFDEEREWLYDEVLDGVRIRSSWNAWDLELSASTGREVLMPKNSTDDTSTYAAIVRYHLNDDHHLSAYAIDRDDRSADDFEPFLYGLRSYAKPRRGLGHWVELAAAAGDDGGRSIDGAAFDFGAFYRFDLPWRPTLIAGYASSSGKRDSNRHAGFRQTGLQDNNAKFGGVTSYKYYGEVLEPMLANLQISTLGLGIRPHRAFSMDLLFHTYRMDVASSSLVDSNLRTMPNGDSRDVGWAADMVTGYRYFNRLSAELVLGHFSPGRAFDNRDNALKLEFQLRLKF